MKLHRNDMKCRVGCNTEENQFHIFEECTPILNILGPGKNIKLNKIYGTLEEQISMIDILVQIEDIRVKLIKDMQANHN